MHTPEIMSSAIPKIRPRESRGDRTRARLVEAALAEFRRQGFERASIAAIAEAAGVSRPTFYFHFDTKEDLLREVLLAMQEDLADRTARTSGLRAALSVLVEGVLALQAEVGAEVFAEMLRAQTRAGQPDRDEPGPVATVLAERFAEGAVAGELRAGLEPERAQRLCLAALFGCLLAPERAGSEHAADLVALTGLFLSREALDGAAEVIP